MFRLHIDIPLPQAEEEAIANSKKIMEVLHYMVRSQPFGIIEIEQVNYRLGHDEDRQKSNYLDKNDNGHVSNKKSKIVLTRPLTDDEAEVK